MRKKYLFWALLFIIGIALRFYLIPQNLFFGPEQGIDFAVMKRIAVDHDLTLIGAKTDVSGVFHGPIYYYLSIIPFLLSGGSPVFILFWFICINTCTIFIIYRLGFEITTKRAGIIAAILFTFSYGAIVYSRWLSTHPLSFPLATGFILSIILFLKGNKYGLYAAAIIFGLLGQAEFLHFLFYGVLVLFIILWYRSYFLKLTKRQVLIASLLLIIFSSSNYILFDIKHNFLITGSLIKLLRGGSGYYIPFFSVIGLSMKVFISSITQFLFPISSLLTFLILLTSVLSVIITNTNKNKYTPLILAWIFTPLFVLIITRHDVLDQFYVSIAPGVILIVAMFIDLVIKKSRNIGVIFISILVLVQLWYWSLNIPENRNIFFQSTQPKLFYSDQLKAIDYIYNEASKEPFSIQAYTIPYWMQEGWIYLFWQYGFKKYNYLPIKEKAGKLYVIVQDDNNIEFQNNWLNGTVVTWGRQIKQKRIGTLSILSLQVE